MPMPVFHAMIPSTKNFPAADVILFTPLEKRFILIQVTVNGRQLDCERALLQCFDKPINTDSDYV